MGFGMHPQPRGRHRDFKKVRKGVNRSDPMI